MSYEGYVQVICEEGHLSKISIFDDGKRCPHCGKLFVWNNHVDDTNCDDIGYIPTEVLEEHFTLKPEVVCTCAGCGNQHLLTPRVFRVPTKEETKKWRHYYDYKTESFRLLSELEHGSS